MKSLHRFAPWVAGVAAFIATPGISADEVSLMEALKSGETRVALRYRFENVEDDAVEADARASTLRTTLSYRTGAFRRWSLFLEAENVTTVGNDRLFNNAGAGDRSNGVTDRPVVADPGLTELNQAYTQWASDDTTIRVGRQEWNLADQRFVGAVGWRQNHQSFDAVTVENRSLDKVTWSYGFVDRTNRIFGDNLEMTGHVAHAKWDLEPLQLRLYGLSLDFSGPAALSTRTLGVELTGAHALSSDRKFLYELEYADQQDAADNPREIDATYLHAMVGLALKPVTVRLGWEVLDGSEADGQFTTPLATLHKFNGWADKFLRTPIDGLEDRYLQVGGSHGSWTWAAFFHQFEAESSSLDYGEEIDLSLQWKADWGQVFALKVADYQADQFSTDTTKWMVWSQFAF